MSNLPVRKTILKNVSLVILTFGFILSCGTKKITLKEAGETSSLIPIPAEMITNPASAGSFNLTNQTNIYVDPADEKTYMTAVYLAGKLRPATGFPLKVGASNSKTERGNIYLKLVDDGTIRSEGYRLSITTENIILEAAEPVGLFYGIQTLRQLLPDEIEKSTIQNIPWKIRTVSIKDFPRYKWRGAMLDVARHFFSTEDVKQYIDYLAFYKMNRLHLHLTDDQGWRIEIKSWPELAAIGGRTAVDGDPGGYYTQEDYKEIVDYAKERFITVIPEIDMPGHTNTALASYPELNCSGIAPELYTGIEVGFSSLCIKKEITYKFIEDVIKELAVITPGEYIHIGGDEAKSTEHQDYVKFIERVEKIVHSHGKKMIGWEEISTADVSSSAVAQFWDSHEHAFTAAKKGMKIIMSPSTRIYLDMKYEESTPLGLFWAGYTDVQKSYSWDPETEIPGVTEANILGIEAPLWTETIKTMNDIEYMAFPRLAGAAEIGWSQKGRRDRNNYRQRLINHKKRFEALDINYYRSPYIQE
ncbi:MAG: beta-N-acetylhexosaminidase [Ignavibacteria bacterium]